LLHLLYRYLSRPRTISSGILLGCKLGCKLIKVITDHVESQLEKAKKGRGRARNNADHSRRPPAAPEANRETDLPPWYTLDEPAAMESGPTDNR
jgi:hypothetical protein